MPDSRIRDAYDRVTLDPESSSRILSALEAAASPGEETANVKKIRKPLSVFVVAAILAVLMVGTAYAAFGVPAYTGSHYMHGEGEYRSLAALDKVEKTVGYPVTAVERFTNGYAFEMLSVGGEAVYDEEYNVLEEYYGVMIQYCRDGAPDVMLCLSPVPALSGDRELPEAAETQTVRDVTIRLNRDHYKLVPPDYEKTPEDEANIAAGHYMLSYGSDQIEEYDYAFAGFTLGSVEYVLMCQDADRVGLSELAAMAAELIAAGE